MVGIPSNPSNHIPSTSIVTSIIMSEENATFNVGDRIILTGLVKAKRLNYRHGAVGKACDPKTGRYAVDLDLPGSSIAVKASNLKREPPIPADVEARRAAVSNGKLVEVHGRDMSFILDHVRFLVAYLLLEDPGVQSVGDIDRLKDESMIKVNFLTATAWSHWVDIGAYRNTGGKGMYLAIKDWLQNQMIGGKPRAELPPDYQRKYDAIDATSAVAGWNVRVHGDFWIFGDSPVDDKGTYCVLASNPRCVYQVVGMSQALGPMIASSEGRGASRYLITMIPWYGRLVYDGIICPVGSDGNQARYPHRASTSKLAKLREAIRLAKEEGRVISRLAQLEVDISPLAVTDEEDSDEEEESKQPPASDEEAQYVARLKALSPMPTAISGPQSARAKWTFRRYGYTEEENPNFLVFVIKCIDVPDAMIGQFKCDALEPTPCEVLKALSKFAEAGGYCPKLVNIDEKKCFKRVRFLLRNIVSVLYYLPPSKEEQAAQFLCDTSGQNPTVGL